MEIKCPHCGVSYEVEKEEMYRYTICSECGKGFVVGATSRLLPSDTQSASAINAASAKPHASSASRIDPASRSRQAAGSGNLRSTRIPTDNRQGEGLVLHKNGFWSFTGHARRKEYWSTVLILAMTCLVLCVVPIVFAAASGLAKPTLVIVLIVLAVAVGIVTGVAQLPVSVRRLHDVDLSGFWLLLRIVECIPYVGFVFSIADFIVLGCLDGTRGSNKYGPDPKGRQSAQTDRQQRQAQIPQTQNGGSIEDVGIRIKKLAEMENLGLLTEEEYVRKKEEILSRL